MKSNAGGKILTAVLAICADDDETIVGDVVGSAVVGLIVGDVVGEVVGLVVGGIVGSKLIQ